MSVDLVACDHELWPGAPDSSAWRMSSQSLAVTVTALGAHLCAVDLFDQGAWHRVSVDYPAGAAPRGFHGATAGRWANRIAGAAFELDGRRYALEANEGTNQLHGGPEGFNLRVWSLRRAEQVGDRALVELELVSADGDQGFPGTLAAQAIFELRGAQLTVTYTATTDHATVVNLTNHVYWNLGSTGSLDGHSLALAADRYVAVDRENIPLPGPARAVRGTRFDCRSARSLTDVVAAGGYDHCFVVDANDVVARLTHESGRSLAVATDQPGVQVYTAQHLAGRANRGIALEAQRIPDAPNRPDLGPSALRPGERYRARTVFRFGTSADTGE